MSIEEELKALDEKGNDAYSLGQMDEALGFYQQRIALATSNSQPEEVASSHKSMGLILHDKGEWDQSLVELEGALKIQLSLIESKAADTAFQLNVANTHTNLAEVYRAMDQLEMALQHLQEAMTYRGSY